MKFIIFLVFIATLILSISANELINVLDVTDETVNLQLNKIRSNKYWYLIAAENKNSTIERSLMKCDREASTRNFQICRISKLTPGRTYKFVVYTLNTKQLIWEPTNIESEEITTDNPLEKPSEPRGPLTLSNITDTTITINWQKPKNSFKFVVYKIIMATHSPIHAVNYYDFVDDSDFPKYTITGLQQKYKYQFYVHAVNNKGFSDYISSDEVTLS